jgi:hypothetical protein
MNKESLDTVGLVNVERAVWAAWISNLRAQEIDSIEASPGCLKASITHAKRILIGFNPHKEWLKMWRAGGAKRRGA